MSRRASRSAAFAAMPSDMPRAPVLRQLTLEAIEAVEKTLEIEQPAAESAHVAATSA